MTIFSREALGKVFNLQRAGVFYALILIVTVFGVTTSVTGHGYYLSLGNAANVLQAATFDGILAVFETIVLITGNFDLSIASTSALSAVTALVLLPHHNIVLVILICLAMGAAIGFVNGFLVVRFGINAFIVTLGTQEALRSLVVLVSGGVSVTAPAGALATLMHNTWTLDLRWVALVVALIAVVVTLLRGRGSAGDPAGRSRWPYVAAGIWLLAGIACAVALPGSIVLNRGVYVMFAIGIAVWAVMRYTVIGRRLYATGSNAEAARLSGIRVQRYQMGAFIANGLAAAFVGLLLAGQFQALDPTIFTGEELIVITAAVLGGTALFGGSGDVLKSLVGAVLLNAISDALNFQNVSAAWQGVIEGLVLIGASAIYIVGRQRSLRAGRPPAGAAQEGTDPVAAPGAPAPAARVSRSD